MASVRGSLLGSEKEVESLNERIQELTQESETNHEILKKLQVSSFLELSLLRIEHWLQEQEAVEEGGRSEEEEESEGRGRGGVKW